MKIGISTKMFPQRYWERYFLEQKAFDTLEICSNSNVVPTSDHIAEIVKEKLKGFDLGLHSSHSLFHKNKAYSDMEFSRFKFHLWLAKKMDIRQFIFHISSDVDPRIMERGFGEFLDIIEKNKNIEFFVENNWRGYFACEDEILWVCDKIPNLKICLDIGHLNSAFYKGCIKDIKNSIISMKDRIGCLHLHDNNGEKDEHLACGEGNVKWGEVIPLINRVNPKKAILETMTLEDAKRSLDFLGINGLDIDSGQE